MIAGARNCSVFTSGTPASKSTGRKKPWKFDPALWPIAWTSTWPACVLAERADRFATSTRTAAGLGRQFGDVLHVGPERARLELAGGGLDLRVGEVEGRRAPLRSASASSAARITLMSEESRPVSQAK